MNEIEDARRAAATVTTTVSHASSSIRVGETFAVEWRVNQTIQPTFPLYLVITTEADVRFAGDGFLALTAGATAPMRIAFGADRSRAFTPLHPRTYVGNKGKIEILPQSAHPHSVKTAVVYVGDCGEHLFGEREFDVRVVPGLPTVVVQDRFATEAPRKAIKSLDGHHILRIFDGRYEVYRTETGDKLLSGTGRDINFSPTGRFLAVRRNSDAGFDIFDLYSSRPTPLPLDELKEDAELLIWANHDSYLFVSEQRWGRLNGYNINVNAQEFLTGIDSCHGCSGWDSSYVVMDLDRGFGITLPKDQAVSGGSHTVLPIADLFRRAPTESVELGAVVPYVQHRFDSSLKRLPTTWDLGAPVELSHSGFEAAPDSNVRAVINKQQRDALLDAKRRYEEQQRLLVSHIQLSLTDQLATLGSSNQIVGTFQSGHGDVRRTRTVPSVMKRGAQERLNELARTQIAERLAQIGMRSKPILPGPLVYERSKLDGPASAKNIQKLDAMIGHLRKAIASVNTTVTLGDDPCLFDRDLFKEADRIYRWEQEGKLVWFVNVQCTQGTVGAFYSSAYFLIEKDRKLIGLYLVGRNFGGVGKGWTDDSERLELYRLTERFVALASPLNEQATLIDLYVPQAKGPEISLDDASLLSSIAFSEDGGHTVQFNRDGRIFVRRFMDNSLVLAGAYVDDEVVMSTPDGKYDSTFEGAQLVNVRFAGIAESFQFEQYEAALYRQGLVSLALSGRSTAAVGEIGVPPTTSLYLDRAPDAEGKRNGVVKYASRSTPIKAINIFVDGRTVATLSPSAGASEITFAIADPGPGHWIGAIAVDGNRLSSLSSAVKIPGKPKATGRLNGVFVGVDEYADPNIPPLKQAKYDANNFATALASLKNKTFSDVSSTVLLDRDATRDRVLNAVRSAADNTKEADILVVYFAGHGFDGHDYGDAESTLYLVNAATLLEHARETAIAWKDIAQALAAAKGTVLVVLDACHAGFAGKRQPLSNDDAAKAMLTRAGAPIVVLAASKGRQLSEESPERGGRFTNALVSVLGKNAQTSETLNLGDFYSDVKATVMKGTDNRQTPWMVRSGLVGEMRLF